MKEDKPSHPSSFPHPYHPVQNQDQEQDQDKEQDTDQDKDQKYDQNQHPQSHSNTKNAISNTEYFHHGNHPFGFREKIIALITIVRREIIRFFRIWTQTLLPPVISVLLYFIIFGNLIGSRIGQMGGVQYIEYIVPGLIMMSIITNAYGNVVASFFGSKFQRNLEEMQVSPMSNNLILWGYVLGGVVRGVVVGILVTILSTFFAKLLLTNVALIFLVAILTATLFSLAGLLNGIYAKKFDDINLIPTFVLTPLTYLGGIFYSIELLPKFWQAMTYFNPIFYMVNAFRYGMLGYSDVNITTALVIIILFTAALYWYALILLNKGVGIRS